MKSFQLQYKIATPHGIICGIAIPEPSRIPHKAWHLLHKKEQRHAQNLNGIRKMTYVGGRVAAKYALQNFQKEHLEISQDIFGAPLIEPGLVVSISHKSDIAVAMISQRLHTTIGIDIETLQPQRPTIAKKVLTDTELELYENLPPERQWGFLLLNFSIKECIFKALAPRWKRYIGFHEAEVFPHPNHCADIFLKNEGKDILPISIEARYIWHDEYVISTVQATWASSN